MTRTTLMKCCRCGSLNKHELPATATKERVMIGCPTCEEPREHRPLAGRRPADDPSRFGVEEGDA